MEEVVKLAIIMFFANFIFIFIINEGKKLSKIISMWVETLPFFIWVFSIIGFIVYQILSNKGM